MRAPARIPFVGHTRLPLGRLPQPPQAQPRRVALIVNPSKKRHQLATDHVLGLIAAERWPEPLLLTTTVEEPGGPQALTAIEWGADHIVVAGGDGTVREVVGAIADAGLSLGIVPLGTANLFARNLLLPTASVRRCAEIALHGPEAATDIGFAIFTQTTGHDPGLGRARHVFLVLSGIGHDADTVVATRPELKRRLGWAAYFESGARHLLRPPLTMQLTVDDADPVPVRAWSILVANCGRLPASLEIMPTALIDDGRLDYLIATVDSALAWIPIGVKGLLGLRASVPGLTYGVATRVVIEPERPVAIQLDGDPFPDVTRLDTWVDRAALRVKVPARPIEGTGSPASARRRRT